MRENMKKLLFTILLASFCSQVIGQTVTNPRPIAGAIDLPDGSKVGGVLIGTDNGTGIVTSRTITVDAGGFWLDLTNTPFLSIQTNVHGSARYLAYNDFIIEFGGPVGVSLLTNATEEISFTFAGFGSTTGSAQYIVSYRTNGIVPLISITSPVYAATGTTTNYVKHVFHTNVPGIAGAYTEWFIGYTTQGVPADITGDYFIKFVGIEVFEE